MPLFVDDMMIDVENTKEYTKQSLGNNKQFKYDERSIQKSTVFLYTNNEQFTPEVKKKNL